MGCAQSSAVSDDSSATTVCIVIAAIATVALVSFFSYRWMSGRLRGNACSPEIAMMGEAEETALEECPPAEQEDSIMNKFDKNELFWYSQSDTESSQYTYNLRFPDSNNTHPIVINKQHREEAEEKTSKFEEDKK